LTPQSIRFPYTTLFRSSCTDESDTDIVSLFLKFYQLMMNRHKLLSNFPNKIDLLSCYLYHTAYFDGRYRFFFDTNTPWHIFFTADLKSTRLNSSHVKIS